VQPIDENLDLVRSAERVRELGEVLTPPRMVEDMLDLLPEDLWEPDPSATFLEPACGDGNFLVAVLRRKAARVLAAAQDGTLPAGTDDAAHRYHLLQALSSVYGVDISPENIDGFPDTGQPGARQRMLTTFLDACEATGRRPAPTTHLHRAAAWIVARNIRIGDMNPLDAAGDPAGDPDLTILAYEWRAEDATVTVSRTSVADVLARERMRDATQMTLEVPPEPQPIWSGPAERLHEVGEVAEVG